jgi:hypothetical protein
MLIRTRFAWVGGVVSLVLGGLSACSGDEGGKDSSTGGANIADGGRAGGTSAGGVMSTGGARVSGGSANGGNTEGGNADGGSDASAGAGTDAGGAGGEAGTNATGGVGGDGGAGGESSGGGTTTGGAATGGAISGGATSGGATSGGATSGGATSGGATSGGATSAGVTSGGAATGGHGGAGGAAGDGGDGGAESCGVTREFQPDAATVYVMVDRSGSMFDCLSTSGTVESSCADGSDTAWTRLKTAALSVIQERQAEVRFGFAAFTGTNPGANGTCPILNRLEPKLSNYADIKAFYDALAPQPNTTVVGQKFETPTRQSLDLVGAALLADPAPGKKYILLVTDGQPDYCDDGNTLCAPDSVIGGLQSLYAQGITTLVMGIQSAAFDLPATTLKSFATAGAGENTLAPLRANDADTFAFYDQCSSVSGWRADLVKSGKTAARGVTVGTYSATSGAATPYTPNVTDSAALTAQLGAALSSTKSCSIELASVYGRPTEVDSNKVNLAALLVNGSAVPYDASNGWSLPTSAVVQLNGGACTAFRTPSGRVTLDFPCAALIFP